MKKIVQTYLTSIGLLYSIGHIFVFITADAFAATLSFVSFFLCFLSVTSRISQFNHPLFYLLKKEEAPLIITGIIMTVQSAITAYSGFMPQAIIGFGFATGNIIKAIELETEKNNQEFLASTPFLKAALRPELMHSIANVALAYFSSEEALWFLPLMFASLFLSFLPNYKGQKINYAWARALLTLYYLTLMVLAFIDGNFIPSFANFFFVLGSLIITVKMNNNFRKFNKTSRGFSILRSIW
ncbi:MAG: hypothetical protein KTR28_06485 [Micavibrio sp.]|nr:hypothetical protein [Micavibrio sp.]